MPTRPVRCPLATYQDHANPNTPLTAGQEVRIVDARCQTPLHGHVVEPDQPIHPNAVAVTIPQQGRRRLGIPATTILFNRRTRRGVPYRGLLLLTVTEADIAHTAHTATPAPPLTVEVDADMVADLLAGPGTPPR